jgi:Tol biopolymer transport system component
VKFGNPGDGGDPGRPTPTRPTPSRGRARTAFIAPLIAIVGLLAITIGSVYGISLLAVPGAPDGAATTEPGASGGPISTPHIGPNKTPNPTLIITPPPADRPTFTGTILFARAGDIWAANGSNLTALTNKGTDSAPAWSPDGSKIYFIQTTERTSDPPWGGSHYTFEVPSIMSMNADGSKRTQIYNGIFKAGSGNWFSTILTPDVSPNGKTIAVVSDGQSVPNNANIQDFAPVVLYTLPAGGGKLQNMNVRNANGLGHNDPAWSPDGTSLAFTFNGKDGAIGAPTIGILTLATKKLTLLKKGYSNPSWSPDMRYIAAEQTVGGNGRDIVVLDPASGAEVAQLTNDGNSFNPAFSPNGDQIAYLKRNGLSVDLRVMTLDVTSGITLSSDKPITDDGALTADSAPAWFVPPDQLTTPPAGTSPGGASTAPAESPAPTGP